MQEYLENFINDLKLTERPSWFKSLIKSPLTKNITVDDWNNIIGDVLKTASDDSKIVEYLKLLTGELSNYATDDELSSVSDKADSAYDLAENANKAVGKRTAVYIEPNISTVASKILTYTGESKEEDEYKAGDLIIISSKETPDFVVVSAGVTTDWDFTIDDANDIPDISFGDKISFFNPTTTEFKPIGLIAIESGVAVPDVAVDSELSDTSKNPVQNKVITKALKGANQAKAFYSYEHVVAILNAAEMSTYNVGQNIYVQPLNTPDLWIYDVYPHYEMYSYTTEEDFKQDLETNKFVQIGHYALAMLETQKVDLTEYPTNDDLNNEFREFSEGYDKYLNNTFATKDELGNVSSALTELHNYAEALKGGES